MLTPIQNGQIQANSATGVEPTRVDHKRELQRSKQKRLDSGYGIPKSIYQHITRLVSGFLQQIMGRDQDGDIGRARSQQGAMGRQSFLGRISIASQPLEVRGIADRMPRLVDPDNPFPNRDLILLGEARDFPEPVIAIQYEGTIKPVFYEGNQVVARHLGLDCNKAFMDGQLILSDGSRMPVNIRIITAV